MIFSGRKWPNGCHSPRAGLITASAWSFLPRNRLRVLPVRKKSNVPFVRKGQVILAGVMSRSIVKCPCRRPFVLASPIMRQIFIGPARRDGVTDALERKLYSFAAVRPCTGGAGALNTARSVTAVDVCADHCVQRPVCCRPSRRVLHRSQDPRVVLRLPWCTSASRPNAFPTLALAHPFA